MAFGCNCISTAGRDAGTDAGDADAQDGGRRDGGDSGRDSGKQDGEADSGVASWYLPEGLPATCEVRVAENPDSVRTIGFEPCADRSGCRGIRSSEIVEPGEVLRTSLAAGRHDGAVGTLPLRLTSGNRDTELVVNDTGRVLLALRTPRDSRCLLGSMSLTDGRAGVIVIDLVRSEGADSYILACPIAPDEGRCRTVAYWPEAELTGNVAQDIYAADTHLAVHTTPAQSAWRVEWDGSGRTPVGGWWTERVIGEPSAAANDATFYSLLSTPRIVAVSVGRSPGDPPSQPLIAGDGFDALILRTDGEDMAWHQGYEREDVNRFGRVELWTSPFATTRDSLAPRRVATLARRSASPSSRLGFHRFAAFEADDVIAIYDLRDGSRQEVMAPEGEIWTGGIVYLGPEEIAVASGPETAPMRSQRSVMLIRYDSLGAPVPPSEPEVP